MKTVDTKEYISMLRTLIEEGKQVSMNHLGQQHGSIPDPRKRPHLPEKPLR